MLSTRHIASAAVLAAGLTFAAASANAITIQASDLTNGSTTVVGSGFTATASPRPFQSKTIAGFNGVGIAGGFVDGEIDLANSEKISFSFTNAQHLDSITLGFLFKNGNYGDVVSEVMRIQLQVAGFIAGDLSVITATTATWSGPAGTVTNVSGAVEPLGGVWTIANPFGDLAITGFSIFAIPVAGAPIDATNSDGSFISLTSHDVPEPASLGLLGCALLGFGLLGRRKSA